MGFSQEKLTKSEAVSLALENNYGIKIAKNNVEISKNNASIYNSGYLPRLSATAAASHNNNSSESTTQDNTILKNNNAKNNVYSGGLALNYTLFDGLGRSYNYKKLKESHHLSKLEAQAIIENTVLQVISMYYEVAQLTEDNALIAASLHISKQRLKRAIYGFKYGQNTKLQWLNAEVDVNTDSIKQLNAQRMLANSKRNLNLLLGRDIATSFSTETQVNFNITFNLNNVLAQAKKHNIEILKATKNDIISKLSLKASKASLYPSLQLNTAYNWSKLNNDASFAYAQQLSNGLNAGLSLQWNLFDGGNSKTRVQNAKIYANNVAVQNAQIANELERNIANAFETYNNALFVLQAEEKNVNTNQRNFARTETQFKLGQITNIAFRLAQLNLLNAQSNLSNAKYLAKTAELKLLQLSGSLLSSKF